MPDECANREQSGGAEQVCPAWRKIVCLDLGALVLVQRLLVKGIRLLKPGAGVANIQMRRVILGYLVIHSIKEVFLITFRMNHLELWGIKEASSVQAICRDEV